MKKRYFNKIFRSLVPFTLVIFLLLSFYIFLSNGKTVLDKASDTSHTLNENTLDENALDEDVLDETNDILSKSLNELYYEKRNEPKVIKIGSIDILNDLSTVDDFFNESCYIDDDGSWYIDDNGELYLCRLYDEFENVKNKGDNILVDSQYNSGYMYFRRADRIDDSNKFLAVYVKDKI